MSVTLGSSGAFAVAEDVQVTVPPVAVTVAVTVVDTAGAGDAFMAGLLDGLWQRRLLGVRALGADDLREVLSHAALVAGLTVARAGAAPPTRAELNAATPPGIPHPV